MKTTENNWPDEVRLKMIEKSKFYPDDKQVYQYGFYDGYQYASEQCQKRDEIIKVMYELLEEIYHGGFLDDRNPLLKKIEQLKKELQ